MNESKKLEFLIPSYKRPHSLIKAIESVAIQVREYKMEDQVKISVVDDCSPNLDSDRVFESISEFSDFIDFTVNSFNKGMSLNIRDMVASSQAAFCTILSDDDYLQPNTLQEIIAVIDRLSEDTETPEVASFFVPRYSYLEDGSLHCIVCCPFNDAEVMIYPNPQNSLYHMRNGFVLTGLFFKPNLINFNLWDENIENAYFPMIYFSDLTLNYRILFCHKNWFVHTVLNETHWESWGKTEEARYSRLYKDSMKAITVAYQRASLRSSKEIQLTFVLLKEEIEQYAKQMKYYAYSPFQLKSAHVDQLTQSRLTYQLTKFYLFFSRKKFQLKNFLRQVLRPS